MTITASFIALKDVSFILGGIPPSREHRPSLILLFYRKPPANTSINFQILSFKNHNSAYGNGCPNHLIPCKGRLLHAEQSKQFDGVRNNNLRHHNQKGCLGRGITSFAWVDEATLAVARPNGDSTQCALLSLKNGLEETVWEIPFSARIEGWVSAGPASGPGPRLLPFSMYRLSVSLAFLLSDSWFPWRDLDFPCFGSRFPLMKFPPIHSAAHL